MSKGWYYLAQDERPVGPFPTREEAEDAGMLAMDPPVSEAQRRAMWAAAEGHSTLGIPKKVGEEFVGKDAAGHAAGTLFVAPDGDVLLMKRSDGEANYAGHWALPGGRGEDGESPDQTAERESREEMGPHPKGKRRLIDSRVTPSGMAFHTFAQPVEHKFSPRLNSEHSEFRWSSLDGLPQPLHPGVTATISERLHHERAAADMTPEDWKGLKEGFAKWVREEEAEPAHGDAYTYAQDAEWNESKHPRRDDGRFGQGSGVKKESASKFNLTPKDVEHLSALGNEGGESYEEEGPYADALRSDEVAKTLDKLPQHHGTVFRGMPLSKDQIATFQKGSVQKLPMNSFVAPNEEYAKSYSEGEEDQTPVLLEIRGARSAKFSDTGFSSGHSTEYVMRKGSRIRIDDVKEEDGTVRIVARYMSGLAKDADCALDRNSVRSYDHDGRLHVATTPISKANVCPYFGREVPNGEELGLDPDRRYMLYRDPEELAKAASTFNNLPLLSRHVPVDARDHKPELVIGSTGTDAAFDAPYLNNSLVLWAKDAIEDVESEAKKELSSAYRYRADMTPGTHEGQAYDGVMRDIVGNHVALVREGRAGSDVVVGDSAIVQLKELLQMSAKPAMMSRASALALGALLVHLRPKLAQDQKVNLIPALAGVTGKNFKEKVPTIVAGVTEATKGKLAKDASLSGVSELLHELCEVEKGQGEDGGMGGAVGGTLDPNSGLPANAMDAEEEEKKKKADEFLKGKLSAEDMATYDSMRGAGKARDAIPPEFKKEMEEKVDKKAMDAAIGTAVTAAQEAERKRQRDARDAEKDVRKWVGELAPSIAMDSAEGIYRAAISALNVKPEGLDALPLSALKAILHAQPLPSRRRDESPTMATDQATADSFKAMFPSAARIQPTI